MTRGPPYGPPQGAYQGNEQYGYQQPQYGSNEPNYGAYNPGEGQAYGANPQGPGPAQGYYGSNEQPYQQCPNNNYSGYEGQQYQPTPPPPGASHVAPHMQPPQYGAQYPTTENPPYGQQYPPQPAYGYQGGSDIDAFKSHYEQPYGPIDPSTGQPLPPGAEGDRGVMGALAGGAAGIYGGHKIGHGFLGGIGGAVAGSMAEDAWKKHRKEKKQRRGSGSSCSSSDDGRRPGQAMAGNFMASSRDVRLEDRCMLVAECCNSHGHHHKSHLDLNECFTNDNGRMLWARGGNFAASSRNIRLTEGGQALEAELGDGRGGWLHNKVYLNERITNEDGRLAML